MGKLKERTLFIQGFQCCTNISHTLTFLKEEEFKKELFSIWISRGLDSLMVKMQLSGDWQAGMKSFLALPEAVELKEGELPPVLNLQEVPLWLC